MHRPQLGTMTFRPARLVDHGNIREQGLRFRMLSSLASREVRLASGRWEEGGCISFPHQRKILGHGAYLFPVSSALRSIRGRCWI
jgi:hypothetical protein